MPDFHPAAKALIWDTEEKFYHAFWRSPREKNLFHLFTSSFVSVLRASWTLINFTEFPLVLYQSLCVSMTLSNDSGLLILWHWSELRDEKLISKQFCVLCVSASFPHRSLSSSQITAGLHLLNPTTMKFHFIISPFTRRFGSVQTLWIQQDE